MDKSGMGVTVVSPPEELELLEDELELLDDELELLDDELELLEDELELEDEELLEDDELLDDPVLSVSSPQPASATDANASMNQREN
ncbi:hypothetical protein WME99_06045 [Sorangium sp. So ce136]|uniref:hypothetical protein n=1 Tax=Sorangium sp. So ce136 TaxID=3133284 RepID=UPI003F01C809